MGKWTQSDRQAGVYLTGLPNDTLLLERMTGREEMSMPFEFHLELLSEDPAIDFDKVLGLRVAVRVELLEPAEKTTLLWRSSATPAGENVRWFNGIVKEFAHAEPQEGDYPDLHRYHAVMAPAFWFLSLQKDCRIFQEKKAVEIVTSILKEEGFDFSERLFSEHYKSREYCVQYNESTFNFISRLLEYEGVHYYFDHSEDHHVMVLADGDWRHGSRKGYSHFHFNSTPPAGYEDTREFIWSWQCRRKIQSDRVMLKDFDFKVPGQCVEPRSSLLTSRSLPRPDKGPKLQVFEYPGCYTNQAAGETLARIRAEEHRVQYETYVGKSNSRAIAPGHALFLQDHPDNRMNREYLVTSCDYCIEIPGYRPGPLREGILPRLRRGNLDSAATQGIFTCTFTTIVVDETLRFRPARVTPKPVVQGPQTAVVTTSGPSEEIHTDEYGRVKVHFFWDRHNEQNDESSCWLRVSMPWAGKGWGGVQIPREGQEVIVDFLEGDPDQPIITGRVYNAATMPPLSNAGRAPGAAPHENMKQAAMQMSLKSNSLGGSGGHNEITMNDVGGKETLLLCLNPPNNSRP